MHTETTLVERPQAALVLPEGRGIELHSIADFREFALEVVKSKLAPRGFETPEAVLIAMQLGAEVGLAPMQALQNICVINGKPALYGDAALAIVRASGLLEEFSETLERGEGDDNIAATCYARRKGYAEHKPTRFSVADAKKAGLWGKSGPWSQYPKRMLAFRARGFELRDQFGDVLKGLKLAEEVQDYPPEKQLERVRVVLPDEVEQIEGTTKEYLEGGDE